MPKTDATDASTGADGDSTGPEKQYEPINPTRSKDIDRQVSRRDSQGSSRSLDRVLSLTDGYSHHAVDNDILREPSDEEKPRIPPEVDFIVQWDGPNDPDNPRSMSLLRRWMAVLVVSMGSLCVTCASSLYTMTYAQMIEEFKCSQIIATLGLSLFILGLGIGPLFLAPLSEFFGRRIIYLVSFFFFVVWLFPCAFAHNIETFLVARFLNGLSGSAFLSVAGGTVGDMFDRHELGAPMMVYTASPFLGPEVGPFLGGFISQYTPWRWNFYVLIMWAGAVALLIIFFVPETYHPVLLKRKAIKKRKETGDDRWKAPMEKLDRSLPKTILRSMYRPMMLLTLEPMCLNLCIFSAILLGILYLFFGAFHQVFTNLHGFTLSQVGMSFLGLFVGMIMAVLSDPLWRRNYMRLVQKRKRSAEHLPEYEPEWRLAPAIAGGPLVTIGLFIFAWTIFPHVHWIAPIIGSLIFGTGTILVFSGIFTFLVDAYPLYAASALAANSFLRASFGAVFPLFGIQMYNALGYNWASSLLAFLTLVMAPFPYIFFRFGKRIRKRSRFAAATSDS